MTTLNTRNELTLCCKHSGKFLLKTSSLWLGKTFRPLGLFSVQKIIKILKLTQTKGYIYIEKYLTRGNVSILHIYVIL